MHSIRGRTGAYACFAIFILLLSASACSHKPSVAYESVPETILFPTAQHAGNSAADRIDVPSAAAPTAFDTAAAAPSVSAAPSAAISAVSPAMAPAAFSAVSAGTASVPAQTRVSPATSTAKAKTEEEPVTDAPPTSAQPAETAFIPSSVSTAETQAEADDRFLTENETKVAALVNAEREQNGLAPLLVTAQMRDTAHLRAVELTKLYSHTRPDGTQCFTAFPKSDALGENAARGQQSPAEVMESWLSSEAHRANILNPSFTQIGVGCIREGDTLYWVQCFAA